MLVTECDPSVFWVNVFFLLETAVRWYQEELQVISISEKVCRLWQMWMILLFCVLLRDSALIMALWLHGKSWFSLHVFLECSLKVDIRVKNLFRVCQPHTQRQTDAIRVFTELLSCLGMALKGYVQDLVFYIALTASAMNQSKWLRSFTACFFTDSLRAVKVEGGAG